MPCKKDRIADNCFSTSSGMEIPLWIYHDLKKMGRSKFMAFLVGIISGPQDRTQRWAPVLQSRPDRRGNSPWTWRFCGKNGERSTTGIQNWENHGENHDLTPDMKICWSFDRSGDRSGGSGDLLESRRFLRNFQYLARFHTTAGSTHFNGGLPVNLRAPDSSRSPGMFRAGFLKTWANGLEWFGWESQYHYGNDILCET